MNNECTILVNSCDKYEDTWKPFFTLFGIQWPDCQYPIVLNTETKRYNSERIVTINTPKAKTWSERLINVVKLIESEYIMFFLDDEFLRSRVSVTDFEIALKYMRDNKDVGYILLRHSEKQKKEDNRRFFPRSELTDKYQLVCLSALYRKEFLLKILRSHENPWEYERYATYRTKKYNYSIMQYSKSFPVIFDYDDKLYGVYRGKWFPYTKDFLSKYNIEINYDNLGMYEDQSEQNENRSNLINKIINEIIEKMRAIKSLI